MTKLQKSVGPFHDYQRELKWHSDNAKKKTFVIHQSFSLKVDKVS